MWVETVDVNVPNAEPFVKLLMYIHVFHSPTFIRYSISQLINIPLRTRILYSSTWATLLLLQNEVGILPSLYQKRNRESPDLYSQAVVLFCASALWSPQDQV